jgi:hypothetical protein
MTRCLLVGFLLLCCLVATSSAVDEHSWTDTGERTTVPFTLPEGVAYLSVLCDGNVYVKILDAQGELVSGSGLTLEAGHGQASKAVRIESEGEYTVKVSGGAQEWTVVLSDPPEDTEPGTEWTGQGMESTGLFPLDAGTVDLALSSSGSASAELLDEEGTYLGSVVVRSGDGSASRQITLPSDGRYIINVDGSGSSETWTVSIEASTEEPTPSPTTTPGTEYVWTDTGEKETESFMLAPGLYYLSITSSEQVSVKMVDANAQDVDKAYLLVLAGNEKASKAIRVEFFGTYHLSISGGDAEWTVALTDPPVSEETDADLAWSGSGGQSTGFFHLDPGSVRLVLKLQGMGFATLFDELGVPIGNVVLEDAGVEIEKYAELTIPRAGNYLVNIEVHSTAGPWMLSVVPVEGAGSPVVTLPTAQPTSEVTTVATTVSRFGSRRYIVGNPPANPPSGISTRSPRVAPTSRSRQFGSGSSSLTPPTGRFQRWYPATRWRLGG